MIRVQYKNRTPITLQQFPSFSHDLRHQAFQVTLLLKYTPRESQEDLVSLVLQDWGLEELSILDSNPAKGEVASEDFDIASRKLFGACGSEMKIISIEIISFYM